MDSDRRMVGSTTLKEILVVGGCGFIGSHFCEHILKNTDWNVTILDGLRHAGDVGRLVDMENFDKYRKRTRIFWHDLRSAIPPRLVCELGNFNFVVNFASDSHVDRSISSPTDFIQNNVSLICNLLDWWRKLCTVSNNYYEPKNFIHISTDEVYGPAPKCRRFKEWDRHIPSNPYAASKSAQEAIVCSYWRTFNLPLMLTVTMNNFGERQHPEKLVPKTVQYLVRNQSVPIHAEFKNNRWYAGSRTWLHARNHADALMFLLNNVQPEKFPDVDRPTKINIAGDTELTNLQVVERIAKVLGKKPKYHFVDFHKERPGHDRRYALNGDKLSSLGWKSPMPLDECFDRTVNWMVKRQEWLDV